MTAPDNEQLPPAPPRLVRSTALTNQERQAGLWILNNDPVLRGFDNILEAVNQLTGEDLDNLILSQIDRSRLHDFMHQMRPIVSMTYSDGRLTVIRGPPEFPN